MSKTTLLEHMSFESLAQLRELNSSWRLLASTNAAFVISFLYSEFLVDNKREIPEYILLSNLESYIDKIPSVKENNKIAQAYLNEWSNDNHGWLRKHYPDNSDLVHYDLTTASEKALDWLASLKERSFVGTESRLLLVFELFNQIIEQTQEDPEKRLKDLENQKIEIEKEIAKVKKGEIEILNPLQAKDRFKQAMNMSREIISDFRMVEQNFRELNQNMREKVLSWDKSKGELLEEYFTDKYAIKNSPEGMSFNSFFEFLMSSSKQEELQNSIKYLKNLESIKDIVNESNIDNIEEDWLQGSIHVSNVLTNISEQLRRFVDESNIENERYIIQLIKNIENNTNKLKGKMPSGNFMEIELPFADINLILDRPLFTPKEKIQLEDVKLSYGDKDYAIDQLYSEIYVDKALLASNIKKLLEKSNKVTLGEVVNKFKLKYGLTELLAYLNLSKQEFDFNVIDEKEVKIPYENSEGQISVINMPLVIYSRKE